MKNLLLTIVFFTFWNCNAQESGNYVLKSVNYEELKSIIQKDDGKLYVVNFWATWCKPCIEELPHFMEVNELYKSDPNYKMILVSLDNVKAMDTKVKKFIESNHLNVDVYLLDDNKKMNEWIPATDKTWSGAIPATIFYKNKKKVHFQEMQMTQYELEDIINENL